MARSRRCAETEQAARDRFRDDGAATMSPTFHLIFRESLKKLVVNVILYKRSCSASIR
jgi:hypothetical protein